MDCSSPRRAIPKDDKTFVCAPKLPSPRNAAFPRYTNVALVSGSCPGDRFPVPALSWLWMVRPPYGPLPRMTVGIEHTPEDLWVFGYGSLMWRPGFDFIERVEARLIGAHRSLCVYSFVHRGTPERPGLVLGLDLGGACRGVAFRVTAADRAKTIAYLRAREQVTMVYRESIRRVWLEGDPQRQVSALCYVVDRSHPQYAG